MVGPRPVLHIYGSFEDLQATLEFLMRSDCWGDQTVGVCMYVLYTATYTYFS